MTDSNETPARRWTLLNPPVPTGEAIARHAATSLQSCIEVQGMDWTAAPAGFDASAHRAKNEAHSARTALSTPPPPMTPARAALAAAPPITYEWSITVDDDEVAGGGGPDLQEVERDAAHYLLQYERDGAAVLQIRAVQIIKEITP